MMDKISIIVAKSKFLAIFATFAVLTSCVGNRAVQTVQAGDQMKSCNQLQTELAQLGTVFEDVKDDSGITGKNVGLALAFWPGIIVNEVRANKNQDSVDARINYLSTLYNGKCLDDDRGNSSGAGMADRLRELKGLFDEGLISESEYEEARREALNQS